MWTCCWRCRSWYYCLVRATHSIMICATDTVKVDWRVVIGFRGAAIFCTTWQRAVWRRFWLIEHSGSVLQNQKKFIHLCMRALKLTCMHHIVLHISLDIRPKWIRWMSCMACAPTHRTDEGDKIGQSPFWTTPAHLMSRRRLSLWASL